MNWNSFIKNIDESNLSSDIQLEDLDNDYDRAEYLQNMFIAKATNDQHPSSNQHYKILREYFIKLDTGNLLPSWIKKHKDLNSFWPFIRDKYSTYAERRKFIKDAFDPLLGYLENTQTNPLVENVGKELKNFGVDGLHEYWQKAIDRSYNDPAGAITIAKTLVEAVCKEILNKLNVQYNSKNIDFPELYSITAKNLNLHPEQHIEKRFKSILGGCSAIISNMGNVRNDLSDAHYCEFKPMQRHADLVVSAAGTLSKFLLQTFQYKYPDKC